MQHKAPRLMWISPNNSFDVSRDNKTADDFSDMRKAEAFLRNDDYGRLLFGKRSAAADDTAEHDLSPVAGPILYSGIVGGLQFTDSDDLSGVTVGDAFSNFDGNRHDRIRYDTPLFGPGAKVSLSAGSDQRYDAAFTWGGDYGACNGVEMARGEHSHARREIPPGPGVLTGEQGTFVLFRQGEKAETDDGDGQSEGLER